MNEGHAEHDLDFSRGSDGVLLEPDNASSSRKIFALEQIGVASLLGGPIAGCLLVAKNYRVLGQGRLAWQPVVGGIVGTIVLMILAFVLPEKFPNMGLPIGSFMGTYYYAKQQQGEAIGNHLRAGGRKGSWWIPVGVSLGCAVVTITLLTGVALMFDLVPPGDESSHPVAQVKVFRTGQLELNGTKVTLEQLRTALTSLKNEDGLVWYYREGFTEPPPPVAEEVVRIIVDAELPVRMSSKPDFSDYIDANGKSVPVP